MSQVFQNSTMKTVMSVRLVREAHKSSKTAWIMNHVAATVVQYSSLPVQKPNELMS